MTTSTAIPQFPGVGENIAYDESSPVRPPFEATSSPIAFRELFLAESPYVWNTLRRLGVREADLEDMVHEVFITVHCRLADYDPARPLRPWLFGIAYRIVANYQRRASKREQPTDEMADVVDSAPRADEQLVIKQAQQLVLDALEGIDLRLKTVLVMHDIDECSMAQVAATLAIPVNTAYSRLRAARSEFAASVQRLRLRRGER